MTLKNHMHCIFTVLALLLIGRSVSAQIQQIATPALSPFHNRNALPAQGPTYNVGPNGNSPGALSIPSIMSVKRPLPRKPVQPVFVMKGINLGKDPVVQAIDLKMKELSTQLIAARTKRDNRLAMKFARKMELNRQKLLRHLRKVAPVKRSYAPLPKAPDLPTLPPANTTTEEEMPLLPMPKMPGTKKGK